LSGSAIKKLNFGGKKKYAAAKLMKMSDMARPGGPSSLE
jgi:hypothetical protein